MRSTAFHDSTYYVINTSDLSVVLQPCTQVTLSMTEHESIDSRYNLVLTIKTRWGINLSSPNHCEIYYMTPLVILYAQYQLRNDLMDFTFLSVYCYTLNLVYSLTQEIEINETTYITVIFTISIDDVVWFYSNNDCKCRLARNPITQAQIDCRAIEIRNDVV